LEERGGFPPPLSSSSGRTRTRENPKRKSPFTKRKALQEEENPLIKTQILHEEGKIPLPKGKPLQEEKNPFAKAKIFITPRQKSFIKRRISPIQGKNLRSATSKAKKSRGRIDLGSKTPRSRENLTERKTPL
jgi:hypothetical protein